MLVNGATNSGCVNTVGRVGHTVHRPIHRWTPAVHALLGYLEAIDFPYLYLFSVTRI